MRTRRGCALLLLAAVMAVTGCATTSQPTITTWRNPAYTGPGFRKIFVVGLNSKKPGGSARLRGPCGVFKRLQSAGVGAVPGWQYVPTDRTPDQATMRAAVAKSGADAMLLARLSGFTTQSEFLTLTDPAFPVDPEIYSDWYQPTVVVDYKVATIYTTLFDASTSSQVWTFNSPTYDPATLQQDAPRYAKDLVDLLQSNGLLAPH